ncbi:MAG: hypothetical protein JWR19_692 [Pedosphaera sp.]|nr:hypothetical protein [Pedosphaera sp.]
MCTFFVRASCLLRLHPGLVLFFILGLAMPVFTPPANAAITVVRDYRLGEADPGAVAGGIATNSVDSITGNNLTMSGSPVYSPDVPANAAVSSLLSLTFNGANYGSAALINNMDNFGLEAWVKTDSTSDSHFIAYNGNTSSNGWGILQDGSSGNFIALFGGVVVMGSDTVPTNQWTHLALVRDSGTATFYVNGVAGGTTSGDPLPPTGSFAIGAVPENPATGLFNGQIDEVRAFTFAPGAFQMNDLLYNPAVPIPLGFTRNGGQITLSWQSGSPAFELQYTTNLFPANWIVETNVALTNGMFTVNETATDTSRFYRLRTIPPAPPCGNDAPPVAIVSAVMNGSPARVPVFFSDVASEPPDTTCTFEAADGLCYCNMKKVNAQRQLTFDASQSIDPRSCTNGSLSYHWQIRWADCSGGQLYSSAGITGYHSAVLQIAPSSLPQLQGGCPQDPAEFFWMVSLTITHQPFDPNATNAQSTVAGFRFQYLSSILQPSMYITCQSCADPSNPSSCGCGVTNALPATETP